MYYVCGYTEDRPEKEVLLDEFTRLRDAIKYAESDPMVTVIQTEDGEVLWDYMDGKK